MQPLHRLVFLALSAALPAALSAAFAAAQQPLPADRAAGAAAVTVDDTRAWLGQLASEEFGGRGTGQEGFQKAADFVRDHFQRLGLEPGADGSWFQNLPWTQSTPDIGKASLTFRTASGGEVVVPGARLGGTATASLQASGGVVLAVGDPAALAEADLAGKIVVLVAPNDDAGDGGEPRRGRGNRSLFAAMRALQGKEVAATLLAGETAVREPLRGASAPAGHTDRAARGSRRMPTMLQFGGDDLQALVRLAGLDALPAAGVHALSVTAAIDVPVDEQPAPACNVVGILRGSDPKLRSEYVVVGSHLDHLGRRGTRFYPGADDDGSGTTGVMAVSQMLAKNPTRPARSVLFVCFCGEEMGLLGSRHFVRNPPIPLASIAAELQMDMIGRDEEEAHDGPRLVNKGETAADNLNSLHLVGSNRLAPALHALCLQANARAGFDLEWDQEDMFGRSDHAEFARMGVPVAFFFTGVHRDYHQVTDTPDKIHYEKLLRVATYVYDIAFDLAQQPGRPLVDPELWQDYEGKGSREPAAPVGTPAAAPKADDKGQGQGDGKDGGR